MKLITNIKPPYLFDIILKKDKVFKRIKAAVAYCKNYELFDYCKKKKIKLDYFGRLDDSINLNLEELKNFLTDDISINIVGGNKFHPKVIWCKGYGAYIGSANLTQSAWEKNIECGLWITQKELEANNLENLLNEFFNFIKKKSKSLKNISKKNILNLIKHTNNISSSSKASDLIKKNFGTFSGFAIERHTNSQLQIKKNLLFDQKNLDDEKHQKNSIWNDKNEMRCFLILKKLKEKGFVRGRRSKLCKEMSFKKDAPSFGSISNKVSNYEYLDTNGKKGLSHFSKNTERIYEEYKNTSIKASENFCFFEELKSELRKTPEIQNFEMGKPIGKDRNGITISFKKNKKKTYKGFIKIFRPENKNYGESYMEVRYTWSQNVDIKKEFKLLKQKMRHLIKRTNNPLEARVIWRDFQFYRGGWKTEEEDKQWIVKRVIELLKVLKNSE